MQEEISHANADLTATNTLLRKRLAYFEDMLTKTSLIGFEDGVDNNDGKNSRHDDLEEFKCNLLRKINNRWWQ